jgi:hypothetical protein
MHNCLQPGCLSCYLGRPVCKEATAIFNTMAATIAALLALVAVALGALMWGGGGGSQIV